MPFFHKDPSQDPHETSKADQFHSKLFKDKVNGGIKLSSAAIQLVIHNLLEDKNRDE